MPLSELKKELHKMEKSEIIKLISDLYNKVPEAKNFLDVFTTGNTNELSESYKIEIEKYVFPYGRNMDLREVEARKLIRKVRKMKITELNIELELHYVNCCLQVINDFGYCDENYYIAIEKMFDSAIKGIVELGLQNNYKNQVMLLSSNASDYGIELEY